MSGKRIKLLDGNCIEKSHHRIEALRDVAAGPLPGKSLVVYYLELRLPVDVFPCEDGHAQERSLLPAVYQSIETDDVWIADRNFCIVEFTCKLSCKDAFFIIKISDKDFRQISITYDDSLPRWNYSLKPSSINA